MSDKKLTTIAVYLEHGEVIEYQITDAQNGIEHCAEIGMKGYHDVQENGTLVYWPPHRIKKIKVYGNYEPGYKVKRRFT